MSRWACRCGSSSNSEDVIHSLYVPVFRVKKDVVPGRYNKMWFQATKLGDFDVECTNYCGTDHSQMLARAIVQEPEDFKKWLIDASVWVGKISPIDAGANFYKQRGCSQCHSVDGTRLTGPTWKDMFGSQVPLQDGKTVLADEDYVRESIEYPQAKIVAGFGPVSAMPSYLGMKPEDIYALISYMKSISTNFHGDLEPLKTIGAAGDAGRKFATAGGAAQNGGLATSPSSNNPQPTDQARDARTACEVDLGCIELNRSLRCQQYQVPFPIRGVPAAGGRRSCAGRQLPQPRARDQVLAADA